MYFLYLHDREHHSLLQSSTSLEFGFHKHYIRLNVIEITPKYSTVNNRGQIHYIQIHNNHILVKSEKADIYI